MTDKPRLKYEKPVSIDLGRVAPILGDTCSVGIGAADCPAGSNNASVPICRPAGASADNDCRTGSSAGTFCWPTGTGAFVFCIAGSGYGASSLSMPEPTGLDSGSSDSYPTGAAGSDPYSTLPDSSIPAPEDDGGQPLGQ